MFTLLIISMGAGIWLVSPLWFYLSLAAVAMFYLIDL